MAVVASVACVVAAVACTRTSDGVPTAGGGALSSTLRPTPQPGLAPPAGGPDDQPAPGVVPTTGAPAAPGSLCAPAVLPPVRTVAQVSDPSAPTATVAVPDGWSMSGGSGDVGAVLEGPSGMRATVSITATGDEPAAAFRRYADQLTAGKVMTTLSILPGPMCGLSGQTLLGVLSDGRDTVQYQDRVVHVPAPAGDYLIAVHVTAPADAPGFDDPAAVLTEDFEIGLP
ncbi:MAG: hypothetical protein SW019_02360 [Actinomycetota bacterium]|nr:hypothetical protein [Actinomycetota bacterium]